MPNLWGLLLEGLLYFLAMVIFPFFSAAGLHQAIGLGSKMVYNVKIILEILFLAVGNFDLTLIGTAIALTIPMWLVRIGIQIWMTIKKVIPLIG